MESREHFNDGRELNDEERAAVVGCAKFLFMHVLRLDLTGRLEDERAEDELKLAVLLWLRGKGFADDSARKIGWSACQLVVATWLDINAERYAKGDALGGRMLACAFHEVEGRVPLELQGCLVDFAASLSGPLQLMRKGQAKEHVLDSLGIELGDRTADCTGVYYALRRALETEEENRARKGRRESRNDSGKTGEHLIEIVAGELNLSVDGLRDRLRRRRGWSF